nr:PREDICTED: glutamic acid-rich protein-like [Linepithema humile]
MDRIKYTAKMRMRRKRALYKIQEKDNIQNTDCQEEVEDEEENRIEMEIEQQDDADISNEDEMEIEQQREEDEMIEKNNVEIEVHDEQEFYLESEKEDEINDETTSDDEIEDDVEVKEIMELRAWAIQITSRISFLDALLKILRNCLLPTLPISAKTFSENKLCPI